MVDCSGFVLPSFPLSLRVLALASCVAAVACSGSSRAEPPRARDAPAARRPAPSPAADPPPAAIAHEVSNQLRHDGEPYLLHRFRIPLARTRIDVVDVGMHSDLDRVLEQRHAQLVINGGYYGTDSRPEGLVIAGGRRINPLLARIGGGVIAVRGAHAEHLATEGLVVPTGLDFAIQCSPRLVVGGQPAVTRVGENTASRTALCIRDHGRGLDAYVANVEPSRGRAGPTLYTFSRQLVTEGCEEALNLDGGPSTGFAWRSPQGVRASLPRRGVRHAIVFSVADGS